MVNDHLPGLESRDATNDYVLDDLGDDATEGNGLLLLLQDPGYSSHVESSQAAVAAATSSYGVHSKERLSKRQKWKMFLLVNGMASLIHGK